MMCTHSLTHSLQLPSSREIDYTQLPHLKLGTLWMRSCLTLFVSVTL